MVASSEPSLDTEVFVAGGGPAGLAAAVAVREKGFDVAVADPAWPAVRTRMLRTLAAEPSLFSHLLILHIGSSAPRALSLGTAPSLPPDGIS